jgi:hypothetical protein
MQLDLDSSKFLLDLGVESWLYPTATSPGGGVS